MKDKRRSLPIMLLTAATGLTAQAQSTWSGATNGEWGTAANWTGGVPNAVGAIANINTALTVNVSDTGTGGTYPYTFGTLATTITSGNVVIGTNTVTTDILTAATSSGQPQVSVPSGGTIFFYANLQGTQGYEKAGAGKLTFRFNGADQAYSGNILISGGILGIDRNGSLGNENNDLVIANGARLLAEPGSNSGTITLPATRSITLTGAQSQIGSSAAAVNLVVNGTIGEDAAGKGLVKTDAGKVTLAGAISYTGETRIAGGTLALSGAAALPSGQNLRFNGTAVSTLDLGGTSQTVRTIVMDTTAHNRVFSGGGSLLVNGDANLQLGFSNGVTYDFSGIDSFTFNRATRAVNFQAVNVASTTTQGDWNLAKSGTVGGTNSITALSMLIGGGNSDGNNGNTARLHLGTTNTMKADTIQVGGFNAGGIVDFQSSLTNPSLVLRGTNGTSPVTTWKIGETSSGARTGQGVVNLTGGSLDAQVTDLALGRHVANSNNADTSSLTMPAGTLTVTNMLMAEKTGTGTPTLTATLTQGGGTVTIGTLTMGKDAAGGATPKLLPTYQLSGGTLYAASIAAGGGAFASDSARTVNLNGGTLRNKAGGNLSVNGVDTTVGGRILLNAAAPSTLHADALSAITLGTNTALSGSGALLKSGEGSLVVNGAATTYTGTLTVSEGTLGGATSLGGNLAVLSGATLAPGNSPGTMTVAGDLTLDGTYVHEFTGGGITADLVNVGGTLDLSGAGVSWTNLGTYTLGDRFTLFGYNQGNLIGTFNGYADDSYLTMGGGSWRIDYDDLLAGANGGTGDRFVTITAALTPIPETSGMLAIAGLLGGAVLLRRRP